MSSQKMRRLAPPRVQRPNEAMWFTVGPTDRRALRCGARLYPRPPAFFFARARGDTLSFSDRTDSLAVGVRPPRSNACVKAPRLTDQHRHFIRLTVAATLHALAQLACTGSSYAGQRAWLDARVTQQTITSTICHRGYIAHVMPSIDEQIRLKGRLLEQRGIGPSSASTYALDFRMPVLLGGSPDAEENFEVIPWEGDRGERRKRRFTVFLRHCVCAGELPLSRAQAAISGDWSRQYRNLWALNCRDIR